MNPIEDHALMLKVKAGDVERLKSKPETKKGSNEYRVSINSWVTGAINGGGPDYTFKNMSGDILIRKK